MIPASDLFDQPTLSALLLHDPLVAEYRAFFSLLDWFVVEQWEAKRSGLGRPAHPESAYLKAFLIRIREGMLYTTQLRRLDRALLTELLAATVHALQEEIPGLGETVAIDVKHIYAWVSQNNQRAYVKDRYDKTKHPAGDPDCRLGVKRSTNQELAEDTQPFNQGDVTSFRPVYRQAVLALNGFPTHLTADAAYDAWYVYEAAARHGGIAAVPLNQHRKTPFARLPDGTPGCPIGLPMHPTTQFNHTNGYRAQRWKSPLLFPEPTGATCDHDQFLKGKGCVKDVNWQRAGRKPRHPGSRGATLPRPLQRTHRL